MNRADFAALKRRNRDALPQARQQPLQIGLAQMQRQVAEVVAVHREEVEEVELHLLIVLASVVH